MTMKLVSLITVLGLGLGVSACGQVDTATRNMPLDLPVTAVPEVAPAYKVAGYNIRVPETLRVSEAEIFYPLGDIVWRGDPMGDRYQQIKAIFEASIMNSGLADGADMGATGDAALTAGVPVVVDIEVLRFHALTNKARYTVGGMHSINFNLTLRDPETGDVVVPTRLIKGDLKAYGGQKAILAERRGQTQKVRITGYLAELIGGILADPATEDAPGVAEGPARAPVKTAADQI